MSKYLASGTFKFCKTQTSALDWRRIETRTAYYFDYSAKLIELAGVFSLLLSIFSDKNEEK